MTGEWRQKALCLRHPARWWDHFVHGESAAEQASRHARAITVCFSCPVSVECRADVDPERDEGVRGGELLPPLTTAAKQQKAKLPPKTGRPREEIRHGTIGGAKAHYQRGGKPCASCRSVENRYRQDLRRAS